MRGGKFLDVDSGLGDYDIQFALVIDLGDDETIMPGMFDLHVDNRVGFGTDDCRGNPIGSQAESRERHHNHVRSRANSILRE